VLQVTPAHGLPLHWPPAQPNSQLRVDELYEQLPAAQVPAAP
jgi:hypothetical protein